MKHSSVMASAADRRNFDRMATSLRGKVFPGALDCVIRDYNSRGARLDFAAPPPAGEHIVLVIWTTGLAFDCVSRWSAGTQIGVQFRRTFDLRRQVPPDLAEIKAQWLNRRRRLGRRELNTCGVTIERWVKPHDVRIS